MCLSLPAKRQHVRVLTNAQWAAYKSVVWSCCSQCLLPLLKGNTHRPALQNVYHKVVSSWIPSSVPSIPPHPTSLWVSAVAFMKTRYSYYVHLLGNLMHPARPSSTQQSVMRPEARWITVWLVMAAVVLVFRGLVADWSLQFACKQKSSSARDSWICPWGAGWLGYFKDPVLLSLILKWERSRCEGKNKGERLMFCFDVQFDLTGIKGN